MKNHSSILFFFLIFSCINALPQIPQSGLDSITPLEMYEHVAFLAADSMRGRNTPSPELKAAAGYIAKEFASYNLEVTSHDSSYFQVFNTAKSKLSQPNSFFLTSKDKKHECKIKSDFVPLSQSGNGVVNESIVFAGYGITAPEYGYDDYANIDVHGKIVMIFTHEPQEKNADSVFDGRKNTEHSKKITKIENALDHGAIGLILVTDPLNHISRRPPLEWPSLLKHPLKDGVSLTFEHKDRKQLVAIHISRNIAEEITSNTGKDLKQLQSQIDSILTPHSFEISNVKAEIQVTLAKDTIPTQNVVGVWKGSDPILQDEVVVIGAHYDHVGMSEDTIVYNGADDNASGTAGVLEVAEAFASCKQRPKRTIVFITFAGEEKGLFGSRYYVQSPAFPMENTVAMFNLDMISRNDSNKVAIIGSQSSNSLTDAVKSANHHIDLDLEFGPERWVRQSDQFPFYRKNIPVLFFNTREHEDLHQPTDDVDKIIPNKMVKIGQLIFSTAWMVANSDERPDFQTIEFGKESMQDHHHTAH